MLILHVEAESFEALRDKALKELGVTLREHGTTTHAGDSGETKVVKGPKAKVEASEPVAETPVSKPEVIEGDVSSAEEVAQETRTETSVESDAAGDNVTYEDHVKPAVLKVAQVKGREGVTALLAKFGADHATKVPQEKWGELLEAANAMVEEAA